MEEIPLRECNECLGKMKKDELGNVIRCSGGFPCRPCAKLRLGPFCSYSRYDEYIEKFYNPTIRGERAAVLRLRQEQELLRQKQQEQLNNEDMKKKILEEAELKELKYLEKQTILGGQGVSRQKYLKEKYSNKTRITRKRKNRKGSTRKQRQRKQRQRK